MSGYVTQEISIYYLYLSDQESTHKERTRRKTEKLHRRCLTGISNSTIYIQWDRWSGAVCGSSDGSSPKKTSPGRARDLRAELRPSWKSRAQALMSLWFLLHKSSNFLGPSQNVDPEPSKKKAVPGRAEPRLGPITMWLYGLVESSKIKWLAQKSKSLGLILIQYNIAANWIR